MSNHQLHTKYTVVITRPDPSGLAGMLRKESFLVHQMPVFKVVSCSPDSAQLGRLNSITDNDWIIFTSSKGVISAAEYVFKKGIILPKFAVIGETTASTFFELSGRQADFVGRGVSSEIFAGELLAILPENADTILLCAREHRGILPRNLAKKNIKVEVIPVYFQEPLDATELNTAALKKLDARKTIWPFFSPSAVRCCFEQIDSFNNWLLDGITLSIGPATSAELKKHGCKQYTELKLPSEVEMLKCIIKLVDAQE